MENKEAIKSITFILGGALLQLFNGIGDGWASTLVAVFGFIIFYIGLDKLKDGLDNPGQSGVGMLKIAALIGATGALVDLIPLLGWLATLAYITAFVLELLGFVKLKSSGSLGTEGKGGVTLLLVAMVLAIVQAFFSFLPFVGSFFSTPFALAALALVFFGWVKVQDDILSRS